MIEAQCRTKAWYSELKKTNLRLDEGLLEKNIFALILLEQLVLTGLEFVFKGGTSLQLILEDIYRFSIDIDIVVYNKDSKDLEKQLNKIDTKIFQSYEVDKRDNNTSVVKQHFKFYYTSTSGGTGQVAHILLDVVFVDTHYSHIEERPIKISFVEECEPLLVVKTPSREAILEDKLTAFAPNTIGVPYSKGYLDIIKGKCMTLQSLFIPTLNGMWYIKTLDSL